MAVFSARAAAAALGDAALELADDRQRGEGDADALGGGEPDDHHAAAFGADAVIDITEVTTEKERAKIVRKLTDGLGADVVRPPGADRRL